MNSILDEYDMILISFKKGIEVLSVKKEFRAASYFRDVLQGKVKLTCVVKKLIALRKASNTVHFPLVRKRRE